MRSQAVMDSADSVLLLVGSLLATHKKKHTHLGELHNKPIRASPKASQKRQVNFKAKVSDRFNILGTFPKDVLVGEALLEVWFVGVITS